MERLTHPRSSGIKTGYWSPAKKDELVARLAAYEDTGLTPEEVVTVNDFEKSQVGHLLKELGMERKKHQWIPATEGLPETDDYVLMSFANFTQPLIGRYEVTEDGVGAWYLGDCDENDTCTANDLYVNAWIPLPKPYTEAGEDEQS